MFLIRANIQFSNQFRKENIIADIYRPQLVQVLSVASLVLDMKYFSLKLKYLNSPSHRLEPVRVKGNNTKNKSPDRDNISVENHKTIAQT